MSESTKNKKSHLDFNMPKFFAVVLSPSIKKIFVANLDAISTVLSEENPSMTRIWRFL